MSSQHLLRIALDGINDSAPLGGLVGRLSIGHFDEGIGIESFGEV